MCIGVLNYVGRIRVSDSKKIRNVKILEFHKHRGGSYFKPPLGH